MRKGGKGTGGEGRRSPGNPSARARLVGRGELRLGDIWERWTEQRPCEAPGGGEPEKPAGMVNVVLRIGAGMRAASRWDAGGDPSAGSGAGRGQPARVWSAPRSCSCPARARGVRPSAHSEAVLASHWLWPMGRGGAPLPGKNVMRKKVLAWVTDAQKFRSFPNASLSGRRARG